MSGALAFERDPGDPRIGVVTLSHPGKLNAISVAMWRELGALAATLDALQPNLHAVILRGEGGDFAAGADIAEFPVHRFSTEALRDYHERLVAPALQALLGTDVPLIAQIEGGCIGGGLEIAACCDLRIAQRGARFGIPIARLGFPMAPDELSVVLDVVGRASAAELLFEARLLDADEALQRGLVQRVVDDAGAEAHATAQRIAALPASVARANKRTLRQLQRGGPTEAERARHFGYAGSATHREGVQAFLGRRGPAFPDDPV
ncbi:enoyl-CoA hydratase-related protein [Methylibium sp.]|jgi:enoyl-CoA hydratase|uniref:enoyl-CoA hydratase/isomerase family protein n=1 Tax=Methylibium sp. TaxID=2067992 RepID=UPI003342CE4B